MQPLVQVAPLPPMGAPLVQTVAASMMEPGPSTILLTNEDIKRFNWGAFLLPQFWPFWNGAAAYGVAHWVLSFITLWTGWGGPVVHFGFAIFLGFRGNQIAIRGKQYPSREHFLSVQRAWAKGAVFSFLAMAGLGIIFIVFVMSIE